METKWSSVRGKVHAKWAKLTDADLSAIHGKRDELIERLEKRYGMDKAKAKKEAESFVKTLH